MPDGVYVGALQKGIAIHTACHMLAIANKADFYSIQGGGWCFYSSGPGYARYGPDKGACKSACIGDASPNAPTCGSNGRK